MFTVDFQNSSLDDIVSIIKYNQTKWGGRNNPIVHCDGKTLDKVWWDFLARYDADVLKTFVGLDEDLIDEMNMRLTPYLMESNDINTGYNEHIKIATQGYSILPTPQNIARAYGGPHDRATLVLFDIEEAEDELVRKFITVNFGTYAPLEYIEKQLKLSKVQRLKVTDIASLIEAMQKIATYGSFVFPIQICAISPESRYQSLYRDMFTVVIGNSITDVIHTWNRGIVIPSHNRTQINQVWIPQELLDNHSFNDVIKRWIKIMATSRNDEQWNVHFISHSITLEQLDQYAHTLGESLRKRIDRIEEYKPPTNACINPFQFSGKTDIYRANSLKEEILIDEPDIHVGLFSDEYWMADVYIELTSDNFSHHIGSKFWWRLPRRNSLALTMFNAPSRIGTFGLPSIAFKRGDNLLKLKLLEEIEMFYQMIARTNQYWFLSDLRSKETAASTVGIELSDKGKYLYGFLELFGGLKAANHVFESRYWRQMIQELSNHDPRSIENRVENVARLVRKKVSQTPDGYFQSDEGIEWIAHEILTLSTQQAREGKEVTYRYFLRKAKQEAGECCSKHNQEQEEYHKKYNQGDFKGIEVDIKQLEEDTKEAMGDLIRRRVLLMGTRAKCPDCGRINWIEIDDLSCFNECKGCRNEYAITPETPWYYKMNSLVEAGCAEHGLVPVTLVFGQLLDSARTSFFFSPSLNLIIEDKVIGDLDIVCIKDDQFIIGEIKQSLRHLTPTEIDKMYDLALLVRPDVVIFSTLDGQKPASKTLEHLQSLRAKLKSIGIKVEWYQLHESIFEPSMYV